MKLIADRPFAEPEAAARKLLEIVRAKEIAYTGVTNSAFVAAGGTVEEYSAGRKYATAQRWFEIDSSGTRIVLLQAGAAL
jgi:hypothetical protein